MELKVWVGGIQRIVCGVTAETTCQDIIMALAHATGQTGRFVLLEQWQEHEKYLLPGDKPLEILEKWGEYASGVRFLLRKSRSGTSADTELSLDTSETTSLPRGESAAGKGRLPREDIRSPGSGSSMPPPRGSLKRGLRTMNEFTRRIVENGAVEDLVKFIALQRERMQLLKEEAELLDSEETSTSRYSELDELKKREEALNQQIETLSAFDFESEDLDQHFDEIYATLVTELRDEKSKVNALEVRIESETSKVENIEKELREAKEEDSKLESLEMERKQELEKLRAEVENSSFTLTKTEEKLNEVLSDLGKCIDQVRLREGVLQDLKLVLKSSS